MKKTVSGIILILLLIGTISMAFIIAPAIAERVTGGEVWAADNDGDGWITAGSSDQIGVTWEAGPDWSVYEKYVQVYADGVLTFSELESKYTVGFTWGDTSCFGTDNEIHVWYLDKAKGYTLFNFTLPKLATEFPIYPRFAYKPAYSDYAMAGVPDFDQRQTGTYAWQSYCFPTSCADALWWTDSKLEPHFPPPRPPPMISDGFSLVTSYNQSVWDDHDPRNVQPLIEDLAWLMDTNGVRTGLTHTGTYNSDAKAGLAQYLSKSGVNPPGDANGDGVVNQFDQILVSAAMGSTPGTPNWNLAADVEPDNITDVSDLYLVSLNRGLNGSFAVELYDKPDFNVMLLAEQCDLAVLSLGYWSWLNDTGEWQREPEGHAVTMAGADLSSLPDAWIAVCDPGNDAFENGYIPTGRVPYPHTHPQPEPPYITHNNAMYVSQDEYALDRVSNYFPACPGGNLTLVDYCGWKPTPPYFTVIESVLLMGEIPISTPNHDVAVLKVTNIPLLIDINGATTFTANVSLVNEAKFNTENFTVFLYANSTLIGSLIVTSLAPSTSILAQIPCDVAGLGTEYYQIKAYAQCSIDSDPADNTCFYPRGLILYAGTPPPPPPPPPPNYLMADLGGGTPPAFFAFDNRVDSRDLNLLLRCLKHIAPEGALSLADLGSRVGTTNVFYAYDGRVTNTDTNLFLQLYKHVI